MKSQCVRRHACCCFLWFPLFSTEDVCRASDGKSCKANSLPEGWTRLEDGNGQEYFWHADTGTSQWERPTGPIITAADSFQAHLQELDDLEAQVDLNEFQTERMRLLKGVKALRTTEQNRLQTPQNMEWRVVSSGDDGKSPRIYMMDNFLSPEECEYLIGISVSRLTPAHVVQGSGNKFDAQTSIRDNEQVWLTSKEEKEDPVVRHIVKRMHRSAHVPEGDAEALQVGRYRSGTKYEIHPDSTPGADVTRPATMIVYLSDVKAGGETIFPVTAKNRKRCSTRWHKDRFGIANCCDVGTPGGDDASLLRILPKRGQAMLFYNHDLLGKIDHSAEHAACPPKHDSEKWIAQRWFRLLPHVSVIPPRDARFDGLPVPKPPHVADALWRGRHDARVLNQKAPSIYLYENFLSSTEQHHFRSLAEGFDLIRKAGDAAVAAQSLAPETEVQDQIVSTVLKRMHSFARVPFGFADSLELVAYGSNATVAPRADSEPGAGKIRPLSMILYLDGGGLLEDGGATFFPMDACKGVDDCCDGVAAPSHIFEFKLDKGKKLGLKFAKDKDDNIVVKTVMPGVVQNWNEANPDNQLVVGSKVVEVDGKGGTPADLTAALRNLKQLTRLRVRRGPSGRKSGRPLFVPPRAGDALLILSHTLDGKLNARAKYGFCHAGRNGNLVLKRVFKAERAAPPR